MEFAEGGELFDYLVSRGRMKESDAIGKLVRCSYIYIYTTLVCFIQWEFNV